MKFKNHKNHFYNRRLVENLYQWDIDDGYSYLQENMSEIYPQEKSDMLVG